MAELDLPNLFVIQRGLSELDQASVVRDSRSLLHPAHPGEAADFLAIVRRLVEREIDRRNRLLAYGGLSLYEIARAIHLTDTRRTSVTRWINQFALRPTE